MTTEKTLTTITNKESEEKTMENLFIEIEGVEYGLCEHCGKYVINHFDFQPEVLGTDGRYHIWCADCAENFTVECEVCGELLDKEAAIYADNGQSGEGEVPLCPDCAEHRTATCGNCGKLVVKENATYFDGQYWCYDCDCENLSTCDYCGEVDYMDNMGIVHNSGYEEMWCEDCMRRHSHVCDECGERFYNDDMQIGSNTVVCDSCYSDYNYQRCENCGEVVAEGDAWYTDYACYCEDCYHELGYGELDGEADGEYCDIEEVEEGQGTEDDLTGHYKAMYEYHEYDGHWIKLGLNGKLSKDCTFPPTGYEWENNGGGCSKQKFYDVTEAFGFPSITSRMITVSKDGSLPNGAEMVFQPMTTAFFKKKLNLEAAIRVLLRHGYNDNDRYCGIHFHIDRDYWKGKKTWQEVERCFCVIFGNNRRWLEVFSRRSKWTYCEFEDMRQITREDFKDMQKAENTREYLNRIRSRYNGHHSALNFENGETIELRIFQSTLKAQEFLAALELKDVFAWAVKFLSIKEVAEIDATYVKQFAIEHGFDNLVAEFDRLGIA